MKISSESIAEDKKEITIYERSIGEGSPCYIIGEIGLNHNGSIDMAKELIDVAKESGVDAVKFQKRHVSKLAIQSVLDAPDERFPEFGKTYREIREFLEFNKSAYQDLLAYTHSKGLPFLCTTFDIESVDFLEELGVSAYKVASHSVTNLPLMRKLAFIGKPVILSSGMCTFSELDQAVGILLSAKIPLAVLHCVSSYPLLPEEANLNLIKVLNERYPVPIGYSSHEMGYLPTLISVGLGAVIVERHITLDTNLVGFDHKLSLPPDDLKKMVENIRIVEKMLGEGEKFVSEKEKITSDKYHVSMVSACAIEAGKKIEENMITYKNPGTGLSPSHINDVLNKRAKTDISADTIISLEMLQD